MPRTRFRPRPDLRRAATALAVLAAAGSVRAEVTVRRLAPGGAVPETAGPGAVVRFDISAVPAGAQVHRADLLVRRAEAITGRSDDALVPVTVRPVLAGGRGGGPLALRPPWYDRLDATAAVRAARARGAAASFAVATCPKWDSAATRLDVEWAGRPRGDLPRQVAGLRVLSRKGAVFLVFEEIDDRSTEPAVAWGILRRRLAAMDDPREVRYRVYRHGERITAGNLHEAERLGDVRPMSGYNAAGRSVDELIALHRQRAVEDLPFARRLARTGGFDRYEPDMPEMDELRIGRLAVTDGRPLPPRTGLFVHCIPPGAGPGKAHFAVVTVVDGLANTRDFSPGNATVEAVAERPGPCEPVLQGEPEVTVFYDYPGRRERYVQWAGPPLANLPNRAMNWGVFVPRDLADAEVRRLGVFFHDERRRYLKPPWPHRRDAVLLSPHDGPWRGYGYGYHEALGTLRSFRHGRVRPFLARRVDAALDWAVPRFGADANTVFCGGRGHWGGTAALQYALRRPGRIAWVAVEDNPDPDPNRTPYAYSPYGRGDIRKTPRPRMDDVWGKPAWALPAESGRSIWAELDLPAYVRRVGAERALPFVSMGAGSQHMTWSQEADLMKAFLCTHNAFMAAFFWGSRPHLPLPENAADGRPAFAPRLDRPLLACRPVKHHPNPGFFAKHFETGQRGYGAGSRLNTRPRWSPRDAVDGPERLELTIFSSRRVSYAGRVVCEVVVRNTRRFRPKPGTRVAWKVRPGRGGGAGQSGTGTVDERGRIHLGEVAFDRPARLVVRPVGPGEAGP